MKRVRQIEEYICDICKRGMEPYKHGDLVKCIKVTIPYTGGIDANDICKDCNKILLNAIKLCEEKSSTEK